ncbi:DCL family protein [Blastomonas fulva]|uniref:DCL family protein n=1 Tax=Blastomonas fulva TaxID=1550728 RepID=UPI003F72D906
MAKKPSRIGELEFASKGEAQAFLRDILYSYVPGDDVSEEHAAILTQALQNHPESEEKIGSGIAGFKVRSAEFATQCFWVQRTDGSTEKFSHKACT